MREIERRATAAKDKKAKIGSDIDLEVYSTKSPAHEQIEDLNMLPKEDKEQLILAGVDTSEKERSGTYIQKDSSAIFSLS